MRFTRLACFGFLLAMPACGGGSGDGSDGAGGGGTACPAGTEPCNGTCVSPGTCAAAGGLGGGMSLGGGGATTLGGAGASGGGSSSIGGAPSSGGSTPDPPDQCTDTSTTSVTLATQYAAATIATDKPNKNYFVHTNWWHLFNGQQLNVNGLGFKVSDPNNVSSSSSDGAPTGYPSLFIGSYQGRTSVGSNLPKQVQSLTSIPTIMNTNASSVGTSNINASYDVWFTPNASPLSDTASAPPAGGAYLMVWLFKPSSRQPRGGVRSSGHTVNNVTGSWDVWVDSSNPPVISYVSTTARDQLSFDLAAFIKDSVANNYGITNSMYLSIVFGGFEIWGGGNNLSLDKFCVKVN